MDRPLASNVTSQRILTQEIIFGDTAHTVIPTRYHVDWSDGTEEGGLRVLQHRGRRVTVSATHHHTVSYLDDVLQHALLGIASYRLNSLSRWRKEVGLSAFHNNRMEYKGVKYADAWMVSNTSATTRTPSCLYLEIFQEYGTFMFLLSLIVSRHVDLWPCNAGRIWRCVHDQGVDRA